MRRGIARAEAWLGTWRHVDSHASARAIPRLTRVLRDTFRSYETSPFRLSTGLLTNPDLPDLVPCVLAVHFEASASASAQTSPLSSDRLALWVYLLASCEPLQDIMYPQPVPKSKWCVYAVTLHVCAAKRLHTRN